jgi:murein DD-endopeptidase MepM/ murein hydrolase activator NlpD
MPPLKSFIQYLALSSILFLGNSFLESNHKAEGKLLDDFKEDQGTASVQLVGPFLSPPYPGIAEQGSIFDHSSPNYTQTDKQIVAFSGDIAYKNCPIIAPAGTAPPGGICDAGYGGYWSYSLGDWIYYDGHDGIDFGISYRPVYAAADADRVLYAGWWDPRNHRAGLGLYIRLGHPNGYDTTYGHLSAISVQKCSTPGCVSIAAGEMIGISGNTGNSIGPHLHFRVVNPSGISVDPYGWQGSEPDPWIYNQQESLWKSNPALVYPGTQRLPSGPALDYPEKTASGFLIDDAGFRFTAIPSNCWQVMNVAPGYAINNSMRYSRPGTSVPDCSGRWAFPPGAEEGQYAVYIRIPSSHATSEGAIYSIFHADGENRVIINQTVFPNQFIVSDGWVFAGKYTFKGTGGEFVELTNQTQDEPGRIANIEVGVDAVRFVPVTEAPPTVPAPIVQASPTFLEQPAALATDSVQGPQGTATPIMTGTALPTLTPEYVMVNVYFVDSYRLDRNLEPFEQPGVRWAKSNRQARTVLDEYFRGPGASERSQYGWIGIYNGFTNYTKFEISEGIARVYLKGVCSSDGASYTIADILNVNLKQFDEIQFVKLYDQNGETREPEGTSDSIPACLEP